MAVIALPKKPGWLFRLWYPSWATGTADSSWPQAEVEQAGSDFEIITFHYQQLHATTAATRSTRVDQLKAAALAAGHESVVTCYVNGTFANKSQNPNAGTHYPLGAYAKSTSGTHPYLADAVPTFLMNPFSIDWNYGNRLVGGDNAVPEEFDNRRNLLFSATNADGCLIDNLGWGVVTSGYNEQSQGDTVPTKNGVNESPRNVLTGGNFDNGVDKAAWTKATATILAGIAGRFGREGTLRTAIYCNGGSQGNRYWDANGPTNVLLAYTMLLMFENWVRNASDPEDPNVLNTSTGGQKPKADWIEDLNSIIDIGRKGRGALIYMKMWSGSPHTGHTTNGTAVNGTVIQSSDDDGNRSQIVQWHKVGVASFMLCTDGRSFFHWRHDSTGGDQRIPKDRWFDRVNALGWFTESCTAAILSTGANGIDIAYASGGLRQTDGTYRRLFSNGVVIVNPDTTSKTVTLPASLPSGKTNLADVTDTDGAPSYVVGQAGISVPRNTALILRGV